MLEMTLYTLPTLGANDGFNEDETGIKLAARDDMMLGTIQPLMTYMEDTSPLSKT